MANRVGLDLSTGFDPRWHAVAPILDGVLRKAFEGLLLLLRGLDLAQHGRGRLVDLTALKTLGLGGELCDVDGVVLAADEEAQGVGFRVQRGQALVEGAVELVEGLRFFAERGRATAAVAASRATPGRGLVGRAQTVPQLFGSLARPAGRAMTRRRPERTGASRRVGCCRAALRLGAVGAVAWAVHLLVGWVFELAMFEQGGLRLGMLALFLLAFALLIAIPFMPGIEIGLSLLVLEGPSIAPFVYLATLAGLCLAFAAGEWMPHGGLRRTLADLGLRRACMLLDALEPLDRRGRLDLLQQRAPRWLRPLTSRYRYLLVALLVNLPGNALLGGGGGIALSAGFSRVFQPAAMVATFAVAVLPVPLTVWALGLSPAFSRL